jgi:hypothetical protein
MPPTLPWFVRLGDRLVARHEKWFTELSDSPDYYPTFLRYASTRDERARDWMAAALARTDFWAASRWWGGYAIVVCVIGLLTIGTGGCLFALLALLLVPLVVRFDRWNRRRIAWKKLAEGEPEIYTKVEVSPPKQGSRVFQSYWTRDGIGRVELDHPMELWEAVQEADEWWQFRMPRPHESNGRVQWLHVHMDLGLVRRDADGTRHLVAGGVIYFSYDPWTDRVDTGDYE